ncbi:MAG TPA: hypothetical protein VM940_03250 [Chthoniobacterales bacterium]|jgi:hypothetical protein|nr:hypothetical protein [Chthoniobacterales bacterium]
MATLLQSAPDATVDPIGKIRAAIEQRGEAILSPADVQSLAGEASGRSGWTMIAALATAGGWSFTFFPNGSVRFASLDEPEQL